VVVRYFGGTLLGVPGLINAYKTATQLVLQTVPIVQKAIEVKFLLEFDYTLQNDVLTIIKQYNCTIVQHEQQLFNLIELLVPLNRLQEVHYKFSNLYGLSFKKIN
jgi:putative IMPACT (imprinted ancient) family translation regulator